MINSRLEINGQRGSRAQIAKGKSWTTYSPGSQLIGFGGWTGKKKEKKTSVLISPLCAKSAYYRDREERAIITTETRKRKCHKDTFDWNRVRRIIGGDWKKETIHWLPIKSSTHRHTHIQLRAHRRDCSFILRTSSSRQCRRKVHLYRASVCNVAQRIARRQSRFETALCWLWNSIPERCFASWGE